MPYPAPVPGPAGAAGPAPAGTGLVSVTGGVLDSPLTLSAGDIVVGGALGVPAVLAAGTNGYILRTVSGVPAWRELSDYGTLAARPAAAAGREGQEYWITDAALGQEYSICVRTGASTFSWKTVPTGAPWSAVVAPTTAQTTDASATTLATIATTTNKGHLLDLRVSATQSDRSAQVGWSILATVTNAAGACTVRDAYIVPSDGGASGLTAIVDVSGTDIRVRIQGLLAATFDWCVAGTMLVHGS